MNGNKHGRMLSLFIKEMQMKITKKELPGGPVVRTRRFHCGRGSVPGRGTRIPQAAWHGQEINK